MITYNQWIGGALRRRFEWGVFDCALAAAAWVDAKNGSSIYSTYAKTYSTPFGAYRIMSKVGGLTGLADTYLDRIETDFAQRGDIHLVTDGRLESLAIDDGMRVFGACTGDGFGFMHKKQIKILKTWGVDTCHK